MIHRKVILLIAGNAKRKQIIPSLHVHILSEGDLLCLSGFHGFQKRLFNHGIGARDLRTAHVFNGKSEDGRGDPLCHLHPHMNGKAASL